MGKLSAVEMLAEKYDQKAILKEKDIELKKMELQFQGTKGNVGHSKQDEVIALLGRNTFIIDLHI